MYLRNQRKSSLYSMKGLKINTLIYKHKYICMQYDNRQHTHSCVCTSYYAFEVR